MHSGEELKSHESNLEGKKGSFSRKEQSGSSSHFLVTSLSWLKLLVIETVWLQYIHVGATCSLTVIYRKLTDTLREVSTVLLTMKSPAFSWDLLPKKIILINWGCSENPKHSSQPLHSLGVSQTGFSSRGLNSLYSVGAFDVLVFLSSKFYFLKKQVFKIYSRIPWGHYWATLNHGASKS